MTDLTDKFLKLYEIQQNHEEMERNSDRIRTYLDEAKEILKPKEDWPDNQNDDEWDDHFQNGGGHEI